MKYDFEELMKENMNIQESPSEDLNERILHYDREESVMSKKRNYRKHIPKIAAAALTVVLLSGGIAYASSGLWNHFVAKDFGVEEDHEIMKDMNEKGFAQQPQAMDTKGDLLSVTDKDITVTLKQTLADEAGVYVCFEVKYGEQYRTMEDWARKDAAKGIIPDYDILEPEWTDFQLDSGMKMNYSGGISKIVDEHTILYEFFLTTVDAKDSFKDSVMTMSISSFMMMHEKCDAHPEIIVKDGKWDLSWDLSVGTEKRVYHLDRTLTLGEDHVTLKDLEVTPLSCNLTLEYPDGVALNEIGAVVDYDRDRLQTLADLENLLDEHGDMKVLRYLRTGGEEGEDRIMEELPKEQTFLTLDSLYFRLEDKDFDGIGGMGMNGEKNLFRQFDKILDLEEVRGVRIAGKYIDLTDLAYETVK